MSDFIYSDPGPAIDFYMRSQGDDEDDGDGEPPTSGGCLLVVLIFLGLCILYYEAFKNA